MQDDGCTDSKCPISKAKSSAKRVLVKLANIFVPGFKKRGQQKTVTAFLDKLQDVADSKSNLAKESSEASKHSMG